MQSFVTQNAIARIFVLVLAAIFTIACQRGPDEDSLREEIQERLDQEFKNGLFRVDSFRRTGSAPFTDKASLDDRLTVFYNARLVFLMDQDLTGWESLSTASLSYLLGATEKGISGVKPEGNKKGDVLEIHGTSTYVLRSGHWRSLDYGRPRTTVGKEVRPSGAQQLIDELNAIATTAAVRRGGEEIQLVERELRSVARRINLQLDKLKKIYSIASGPREGAYFRNIQAFEHHLKDKPVKVRNYETEGSVENCFLVQNRAVDFAISQGNIAAMALKGEGPFKQRGPLSDLRAMASLNPEFLHVVVSEGSQIRTLEDLKGKRINIGLQESGSRVDAMRIIGSLEYRLSDFSAVREEGLAKAAESLRAGEIDAILTTIEAPAKAIQNLAATHAVRLVPLSSTLVENLTGQHGAYLRMVIPEHTYPRQDAAVTTLGVTAMLITHSGMPNDRALEFLSTFFDSVGPVSKRNLRTALISKETAAKGISIPLHPAAEGFYRGTGKN